MVKSAAVHHRFTPGAKRDRPPAPRPRPQRQPGEDPPEEEPDRDPESPQNTDHRSQIADRHIEDAISGQIIDWP